MLRLRWLVLGCLLVVGSVVSAQTSDADAKPAILTQPRSHVVMVGEAVQFTVRATNATAYRWKRDGTLLPEQTGPTLSLANVQGGNAGAYTVDAEGPAGVASSEVAHLLVQPEMILSAFAGQASRAGAEDGPVGSATFQEIRHMACDSVGALYVIDGHAIRRIAQGMVTTLAGSVTQSGDADGAGAMARFNRPLGIAVDAVGNIFLADTANARLRKITPTGVVSTLPVPALRYRGIALDGTGSLYARSDSSIQRIGPAGEVATFSRIEAGAAPSDGPLPIAVDRAGNVYVSYDSGVVKITPAGEAAPFAGGRAANFNKTGGMGNDVYFSSVSALAVDGAGNVFVSADNKLWRIAPSLAAAAVAECPPFSGMAVDASGTLYGARASSPTTVLQGALVQHSTDARATIVSLPPPPVVAVDDAVTLHVAATGPDLSYQWLRDGAPVPRGNASVLLVMHVTEAAEYSVVVGNAVGTITSTPVRVTVTSTSNPGRLINLSVRARAGTGERTLIAGFGFLGRPPATGERTVLVRGVGPGLSRFGVEGALSNPRLQLLDWKGDAVAANDDWSGERALAEATAAVGAFTFAPGSKDAALLATVPPHGSTVHLVSADGAGGVALAEIYEARQPSDAGDVRLANVSARTLAGPGVDTLTAGFVVGGDTARTVAIRAIGAGLVLYGVTDGLPNPKITLFSGRTRIAENDDWGTLLPIDLFAMYAHPLQMFPQDSALIATLPPGAYTVQVTGVAVEGVSTTSATSGVALVEINELR